MTDVKINEYKLDEDHSAPVADGNDNAGDQGDQSTPTEETPVEETPMETPAEGEKTPTEGGEKPAEGGESQETPAM